MEMACRVLWAEQLHLEKLRLSYPSYLVLHSPLFCLLFLELIIFKLTSNNSMAESIQIWKDYISLDPTYQDLGDLKEKVRSYMLLPRPNKH